MDQYLDLANDGPYGYGPDVLYQANDVIMQYAKGKTYPYRFRYGRPVPAMSGFEARGRHMETTVDGDFTAAVSRSMCELPMLLLIGRICCRGLARKTSG